MPLSQFLNDHNLAEKERLDDLFGQLSISLNQLGKDDAKDINLQCWAPLYSRILPPHLSLIDATIIQTDTDTYAADFILKADDLETLSSIPANEVLRHIEASVRHGKTPTVALCDFELAELYPQQGILYVHDDLMSRSPITPFIQGRDHPILRFKIAIAEECVDVLTHPVLRRGRRISVMGRVIDTQASILSRTIKNISGSEYDQDADTIEYGDRLYISPLITLHRFLWQNDKEDMIRPMPQVSPLIHGDLNTSNILVELMEDALPLWFIDLSETRSGHICFDLAKLETEFRTHVFFKMFHTMVTEGIWDEQTAIKFVFLVEDVFWKSLDGSFEIFTDNVRENNLTWYDDLDSHFPGYFENMIYFLFLLRKTARSQNTIQFKHHYPVAVFFHSMAALKYHELELEPWYPWAKRLALCSALVAGNEATHQKEKLSNND